MDEVQSAPTGLVAPLHLEKTSAVCRGDHVHSGKCRELPVGHAGGDVGHLRTEEATEAAALLVGLPGDDFRSASSEKPQGLALDAELPQRVASVVVGDAPAGQTLAEGLHTEDIHEELGKLPRPGGQRPGGVGTEDPRVDGTDHGCATTRGQDDMVRVLEDREGVGRHELRVPGMAAVVGRLATAGLGLGEVHLHTQVAQESNRVGAGVGEELVSEAGGEEGDAH